MLLCEAALGEIANRSYAFQNFRGSPYKDGYLKVRIFIVH